MVIVMSTKNGESRKLEENLSSRLTSEEIIKIKFTAKKFKFGLSRSANAGTKVLSS